VGNNYDIPIFQNTEWLPHQLLKFKGEHHMAQMGQQLDGWGKILFHGGNISTNTFHMWATNMTYQYVKTLIGHLLTFGSVGHVAQMGHQLKGLGHNRKPGWANILFHGGNISTNIGHKWPTIMTYQYFKTQNGHLHRLLTFRR